MTISRALPAAAAASLLMLLPAAASAGHRHSGRHSGVSISEGHDPRQCSDLTIEFDGAAAARAEERRTIPAVAGQPLRIESGQSSGVRVRGADRADFEVLVCKGAPDAGALPSIEADTSGGRLAVRGPSGEDWVGYLLITAPRGAAIDVEATNGPVGLSGLSGHVSVHSENGPISLSDCPGEIDAEAQNGPISVHGAGGKLRVETRNGPISVALSGSSWSGSGLDARAVNGPVSLAVPADYRTGTVVQSLGHSPFQCRGEGCAAVRRTWSDDGKKIELGDGPVLVRLSTENGPVSVRTGTSGPEEEDED
jgi:hypothetical protein